MLDALDSLTQRVAPADARWTLRAVDESSETLSVRQDIAERRASPAGPARWSACVDGGMGYAATSDLS